MRKRIMVNLTGAEEKIRLIAAGPTVQYSSCPKCGKRFADYLGFLDVGEGLEAGRIFTYCSKRCRRTH
jgi:hypothetical protein